MGHDHVAVRPGGLIERGPTTHATGLDDVALHVIDEMAVPDGLEQAVGESQREDVLRGLLAEEVIDAEHLLPAEHLVHGVVETTRAGQAGPERLLDDHSRALDQAPVAERMDDGRCRLRRDAHVVESARGASQLALRDRHRLGEPVAVGRLFRIQQPAGERGPIVVGEREAAELLTGDAGELSESALSSGSSEVPTTRDSGNRPVRVRWSSPGSSLRRARSPVAPNSTTTGDSRGGIALTAASSGC